MSDCITKKRDVRLDFMRTVAIVLVVWIHSWEQIGYSCAPLYLMGRMGVPLFLALTGATMLGREYKSLSLYYLKRVLPLYLICVFWLFVYRIGQTDIGTNLRYSFNLVSSAKPFWYFSALFVIYLSIPFFSWVKCQSDRNIGILLGLMIIANMLLVFQVVQINFGILTMTFYFIYVLWGYLCYNRKIYERVHPLIWAGAFAASVALDYAVKSSPYCAALYSQREIDIWWYNSPTVMLSGLLLVPLLLTIPVRGSKWTVVSKCSFGMFLTHMLFIERIGPIIGCLNIPGGGVLAFRESAYCGV